MWENMIDILNHLIYINIFLIDVYVCTHTQLLKSNLLLAFNIITKGKMSS